MRPASNSDKTNVEKPISLLVMSGLSFCVGVVGGVGAWAFRLLIGLLHNLFFLGKFQLDYDANLHTAASPWGVGIILVPVIGGLAVVWLVKTFAPEAKGHGVPEVIDAIHFQGGRIRPIVAAVKSLASAICIGSGGSVGREGPIIQIGSAFGSTLGQLCKVPTRQRITLIAAGAAAGIAATFNAPLGGIVFAIELLLISVNYRNLLPVALATVTASYIGSVLLGTYPAFDFEPLRIPNFQAVSPVTLLLFVPFGVLMGLASVLFIKGIYWAEDFFDSLPVNDYVRHIFGMSGVGLSLLATWHLAGHYYIEGVGYATIMDIIVGTLTNPGFLLLLCLLKFVATCLTLGSGGSGGVFSPALFVGAALGASFAHIGQSLFPGLDCDVVTFTLAGMAAGVGASTGAVLTATIMLHELTDDVNSTLPIILTTFIACAVRKLISPESIYTLKLLRRGSVVHEGLQAALDDARCVIHVMETSVTFVDAAAAVSPGDVAIITKKGNVAGVVHPYGQMGSFKKSQGKEDSFISLTPFVSFPDAVREMMSAGVGCGVVFSCPESNRADDVVGVLTMREISLYRGEVASLF